MRFVHDTLPQRVSFGSGEAAARLEHETAALGASRIMVIASKREMDTADTLTENLRVLLRYNDVVMHVPIEVAARAVAVHLLAEAEHDQLTEGAHSLHEAAQRQHNRHRANHSELKPLVLPSRLGLGTPGKRTAAPIA